ncbi:large neutral amino acids transporter small subunit 3 isoform X2 [Nematostella vectensis]|uniref:large neutral amino acids transporter small subunit 3 isoform X2 n=1 Tax=Nematostella vectensis TaxID=45351 RepID=UPI00207792B3|nr:large neutral amino acids transporter small subunit 3 isoform X2 [Nematostella vectensis]
MLHRRKSVIAQLTDHRKSKLQNQTRGAGVKNSVAKSVRLVVRAIFLFFVSSTLSNMTHNQTLRAYIFPVCAVLCAIFSIPLIGWPSFIFVMKDENFFLDDCSVNSSRILNPSELSDRDAMVGCTKQEKWFSLTLTAAVFFGDFLSIISGYGIDRFGARQVFIASSVLYCLSVVLLGFVARGTSLLLFPACIGLAISGIAVLCSLVRASTMYGKKQSAFVSLCSGAGNSAAVVLLFFKVIYDHNVPYKYICYGYATVAGVIFFITAAIFPRNEVINHGKRSVGARLLQNKEQKPEGSVGSARKLVISHVFSGVFLWTVAFNGFCKWRLWFYVASFRQYMASFPGTSPSMVESYANYFGIIQLCSIGFGPILGFVISSGKRVSKRLDSTDDSSSMIIQSNSSATCKDAQACNGSYISTAHRILEVHGCLAAFSATSILLFLVNIMVVAPVPSLQIITFVLVTAIRCFYNGSASSLFLVAFPVSSFGVMNSLNMVTTSLIQCLQYPTYIVLENYFPNQIIYKLPLRLLRRLPSRGMGKDRGHTDTTARIKQTTRESRLLTLVIVLRNFFEDKQPGKGGQISA